MPKNAITPAQITALQAAWTRLRASDDPRVHCGSQDATLPTDRERRLFWAFYKLGRKLTSWKDMSFAEANYCLDIFNGAKPKLDTALNSELQRAAIADPRAWFDKIKQYNSGSKNYWSFGQRGFDNLNFIDKLKLVGILKTRNPEYFRR